MINSNNGNNTLNVCNSVLPANQSNNTSLFMEIKKKVLSFTVYNDQEFDNILNRFIDVVFPVLIRDNAWLLGESIVHSLSINTWTFDYKKWIMNYMIYFVENGQWNEFYDFCKQNIPVYTKDRKIIEAQALSQIQMNKEEYYSFLRTDEARKKSKIRTDEEREMSQIRMDEYREKKKTDAEIELWFREEKHKQDLTFAADAKKRKEEEAHSQITITPEIVTIDYLELEERFIEEKWLVKIMQDGEPKIYYWDNDTRRYVSFETKVKLTSALKTYAYEKYGRQINLSSNEIDSVMNRMIYSSVPLLDKSDRVQSSTDKRIFFQNAYVDLKTKSYFICDTRNYFHVFCLPCDWPKENSIPTNFDKLLDYMFDGDRAKKTLVYEIIGAIVSNVPLKNVFVFQGVSNGGKSTLAEIIMRLFNANEIKIIGSINEIDENKSKKDEGRIKLLCIDDAPNEKWNTSTVSYLKTRSRGIKSSGSTSFKIILSTNYSITFKTEDGRDESMENRIVVVPFEKDLKAANKEDSRIGELIQNLLDEQLEKERPYILKIALDYFIAVLKKDIEFVHQYPLNACVINSGTKSDKNDEPKSKASSEKYNYSQNISAENSYLTDWLRENFERIDEEKEFMMAEEVLQLIKEVMPNTEGRVQDVGGIVTAVFGEDCRWSNAKITRRGIRLGENHKIPDRPFLCTHTQRFSVIYHELSHSSARILVTRVRACVREYTMKARPLTVGPFVLS